MKKKKLKEERAKHETEEKKTTEKKKCWPFKKKKTKKGRLTMADQQIQVPSEPDHEVVMTHPEVENQENVLVEGNQTHLPKCDCCVIKEQNQLKGSQSKMNCIRSFSCERKLGSRSKEPKVRSQSEQGQLLHNKEEKSKGNKISSSSDYNKDIEKQDEEENTENKNTKDIEKQDEEENTKNNKKNKNKKNKSETDVKRKGRGYRLTIICFIILIFIIYEIVTLFLFHNYGEMAVEHWSKRMGVDECHRLLACTNTSYISDKTGKLIKMNAIETRSIYFITGEEDLTDAEACSIESFAKTMQSVYVYSIQLFCRDDTCSSGNDSKKDLNRKELSKKYKNVVLLSIKGSDFFKNTPLKGRWQCKNPNSLESARILAAWRYGGMSLKPEVLLTNETWMDTKCAKLIVSRDFVKSCQPCAPIAYFLLNLIATFSHNIGYDFITLAEKVEMSVCRKVSYEEFKVDDESLCSNYSCGLNVCKCIESKRLHNYCPHIYNKHQSKQNKES